MDEIKPCPFCGGKAILEDMGWPHHVYCIECGIRATGRGVAEEGEQDAIKRWNRREEPEPVEPTLGIKEKDLWLCGNCKVGLFTPGTRYCHYCGRAVKWDETD